MKNLKLLLTAIAVTATPAFADGFEYEIGYAMFNVEESDIDIDLGALYGTLGYRWDHSPKYSSTAEVLAAFGVSDDDVFGADVSLDPSYAVGYKGTLQTESPDFSLYWRALWANIGAEVDGFGVSESADDSGFGIGAGATFRGFTLGYTKFLGDLDDVGMITFGYQFKTQ